MQTAQAARMARCLKTLSDPNRIRILRILVRGEFCVSDLVSELAVDQPKVSHHLAILRSAGIIRCRRDGRHINYSLFPAVHQRKSGANGPMDEFNLGDITVSFSFMADTETAAAAGAAGPAATAPGTQRIRMGDVQVSASPSAGAPLSAAAGAGAGAGTGAGSPAPLSGGPSPSGH
jgi:DNA-binding transcriptional ArsR family regulator